jgi:CDP-paratose 2-epimerase
MSPPSRGRAPSPSPVVITGGCGFIGCNLADALAAEGRLIVVFDAMLRGGADENACWLKARWRDRISIVTGDVRDAEAVRQAVAGASAVLHLAGQVAVTASLEAPIDDFFSNALGTLNVLEAVRLHNPAAPLVFASTNKVYGKAVSPETLARQGRRYQPTDEREKSGVSESAPLDFYSPYGCSKGTADQYVRDYARVYGLHTVVLRMSCIYGQRQFGTEDQGWVAHFVRQARAGLPITIYGDGCQVRDVLHIDDAVRAWLAALERARELSGRVFNLGGGPNNAISLLEAIDLISERVGHDVPLRFSAWRPGDQPWYVTDTRAITEATGWQASTSVAEGLAKLDDWISWRFDSESQPELLEARA